MPPNPYPAHNAQFVSVPDLLLLPQMTGGVLGICISLEKQVGCGKGSERAIATLDTFPHLTPSCGCMWECIYKHKVYGGRPTCPILSLGGPSPAPVRVYTHGSSALQAIAETVHEVTATLVHVLSER